MAGVLEPTQGRVVGKVGEEGHRPGHTGTRETWDSLSQDRESLPSMQGPDQESEGLLPGKSREWYKPLPPCLHQAKECRGEGGRRVQWPEGRGQGPQLLHVVAGHAPQIPCLEARIQTELFPGSLGSPGTCPSVQRLLLVSHQSGLLGDCCQHPLAQCQG